MLSAISPRDPTPPESKHLDAVVTPPGKLRAAYEKLDPTALLPATIVPVLLNAGVILLYWSEPTLRDWRLVLGLLCLLAALLTVRVMRKLVLAARRRDRQR